MLVSVFTVAIYTMFSVKLFPSNGHLLFSLRLSDASALFSMQLSVIFLFFYIDYVFYVSSATMA